MEEEDLRQSSPVDAKIGNASDGNLDLDTFVASSVDQAANDTHDSAANVAEETVDQIGGETVQKAATLLVKSGIGAIPSIKTRASELLLEYSEGNKLHLGQEWLHRVILRITRHRGVTNTLYRQLLEIGGDRRPVQGVNGNVITVHEFNGGSFAKVSVLWDCDRNQLVVRKRSKQPLIEGREDNLEFLRFMNEIEIQGKLDEERYDEEGRWVCPTLPFVGSGVETDAEGNKYPYYESGFEPGWTLKDMKELPAWQVDYIGLELAARCAYLHEEGPTANGYKNQILHRDIKPGNVYICANGQVCLLDFGLSKMPADKQHDYTKGGYPLGSPGYMSPEQLRNPKACTDKTDVWSLGVTLYEFYTRRKLFKGTFGQIQDQHKDPIDFTCLPDPDIKHLLQWMLQIKPSKRPSMEEVVDFYRKRIPAVRKKYPDRLHGTERPARDYIETDLEERALPFPEFDRRGQVGNILSDDEFRSVAEKEGLDIPTDPNHKEDETVDAQSEAEHEASGSATHRRGKAADTMQSNGNVIDMNPIPFPILPAELEELLQNDSRSKEPVNVLCEKEVGSSVRVTASAARLAAMLVVASLPLLMGDHSTTRYNTLGKSNGGNSANTRNGNGKRKQPDTKKVAEVQRPRPDVDPLQKFVDMNGRAQRHLYDHGNYHMKNGLINSIGLGPQGRFVERKLWQPPKMKEKIRFDSFIDARTLAQGFQTALTPEEAKRVAEWMGGSIGKSPHQWTTVNVGARTKDNHSVNNPENRGHTLHVIEGVGDGGGPGFVLLTSKTLAEGGQPLNHSVQFRNQSALLKYLRKNGLLDQFQSVQFDIAYAKADWNSKNKNVDGKEFDNFGRYRFEDTEEQQQLEKINAVLQRIFGKRNAAQTVSWLPNAAPAQVNHPARAFDVRAELAKLAPQIIDQSPNLVQIRNREKNLVSSHS